VAERLSMEVRGLSREDVSRLIESSTLEIPTTEHRTLHPEASDFTLVAFRSRGRQAYTLEKYPPRKPSLQGSRGSVTPLDATGNRRKVHSFGGCVVVLSVAYWGRQETEKG
jgi:hypothetical protein